MAEVNSFPLTTTPIATVLQSLNFALYKATSTTSLAIEVAEKVFTTQAGKDFAVGDFAIATSDADAANFMSGRITAYSGTSLTVDVTTIGGTGTLADWTIRLSGPPGEQGETGAQGPAGSGLANVVEDTTPQLGGQLDVNGKALGDGTLELLKFEETASAINEITVVNAAIGNGPTVKATGDDTNIDLNLAGKGTGIPKIAGAAVVKASGTQTLTGGFKATPYSAGTKSSGTYTPLYSDGNFQTAVNGGAHTLAPPADDCTIIIQYTNNGSAGAITTSGFTKKTGDSITTVNGDDFFFFITKVGSFSHLHVQALQ